MSLQEDVKALTVSHAILKTQLDNMDGKLDKVIDSVTGDYGRPGLMTRVDRLERTTRLSTKLVWLFVSGIIAALTTVAVAAVTGG